MLLTYLIVSILLYLIISVRNSALKFNYFSLNQKKKVVYSLIHLISIGHITIYMYTFNHYHLSYTCKVHECI
jgi:hypothetical protein